MTKWVDKCPYARSGFPCYEKRCPMDNKGFYDALDVWAWTSRTPKALTPEPSIGGGYDPEWGMLRKSRINGLFDEGQLILDWILDNKSRMTSEICRELINGERRYRDLTHEEYCWRTTGLTIVEFIRTNQEFRAWCRKRRLDPIGKRVISWLRKYGLARG